MKNINNNVNNIDTSNYNEGIDDEAHNALPQDYFLPKSTNQK